MHSDEELDYFTTQIKKPEHVLYEELSRDYLSYLGNKRPSRNQLILFKGLIVDAISNRLLEFKAKLTLQEMKCLYLAFNGKSITHTAEILGFCSDTIKYYRKRSIKKLGCKNMVEAAFKCTGGHFKNDLCDKLINEYIRHIKTSYKKAMAQTQLTLSDDFLNYPSETIHYYLRSLDDNLQFRRNVIENLIESYLIEN